jgi:hypothetical protein
MYGLNQFRVLFFLLLSEKHMPMMSTSSGRMPKNGDGNNVVANAREVLAQSFAFYIIVLRTL